MAKRRRRKPPQLGRQLNAGNDEGDPGEAARAAGIYISLLIESPRLTSAQRLARLDEQVEALRELRRAAGRAGLLPEVTEPMSERQR